MLNNRSSTETELVATDDAAVPMLWTSRFLLENGDDVKTILYQDNRSAIVMESNVRSSMGKRSRHLDIRYFFINDLKEKVLVSIKYCPTEEMVADYMNKPLQGSKFTTFRKIIMIKKNSCRISMLQKFLQEFLQGDWYRKLPGGRMQQVVLYECHNNFITS